jgi:hypothetical protein
MEEEGDVLSKGAAEEGITVRTWNRQFLNIPRGRAAPQFRLSESNSREEGYRSQTRVSVQKAAVDAIRTAAAVAFQSCSENWRVQV